MMKLSGIALATPALVKAHEEYMAQVFWVRFAEFWQDLGEIRYLHEKRETLDSAIQALRGKYIRKGRPVGWRKDKAA